MSDYCKIEVIGNLGRDPEARFAPSGSMYVKFSVAVARKSRDNFNQSNEQTIWFSCAAWNKMAEKLDKLAQNGYLCKGRQVFIRGSFTPSPYVSNGVEKISFDINIDDLELLGAKPEGTTTKQQTLGVAPFVTAPFEQG